MSEIYGKNEREGERERNTMMHIYMKYILIKFFSCEEAHEGGPGTEWGNRAVLCTTSRGDYCILK